MAPKKDPKPGADEGKKPVKKRPKRADDDDSDADMWASVGDIKKTDLTKTDNYLKTDTDKHLDKRYKDAGKDSRSFSEQSG